MKKYWEQLKPLERRWAVGAGVLVFIMLNYFFIWPHRHDWARDDARAQKADKKISEYNAVIAKKAVYLSMLRKLQADGSDIPSEDQAIDFVRFYSGLLLANHVLLQNGGTLSTRTNNPFFIEQQLGIRVQADETNLVNFLYNLGAGNSMVRVKSMDLRPTPDKHELSAGITMVASYLKKSTAASKAAPGKAPPATPTTKTAAAPKPATTEPAKRPPTAPPATANRMPPPAVNSTMMSNRMARFLRPGTTNKTPR